MGRSERRPVSSSVDQTALEELGEPDFDAGLEATLEPVLRHLAGLAPGVGLEPTTNGLTGRRYYQLSYPGITSFEDTAATTPITRRNVEVDR